MHEGCPERSGIHPELLESRKPTTRSPRIYRKPPLLRVQVVHESLVTRGFTQKIMLFFRTQDGEKRIALT